MKIGRRPVMAGSAAVAMLGAARAAGAETPAGETNPWSWFVAPDGQSIKAVEVSIGADGKAGIKEIDVTADKSVAPKLFQQFLTHKASKVAIYSAPPYHKIDVIRPPIGGKPAREFAFIVDGETTIKIGDASRKVGRGTVLLFDGAANYKEKAGPVGYTAIKVRLAD